MADFYTILTSTGRAKLANAQVTGVPVSLTHMGVGDGENGAYYLPSEVQTTLKHEVWRDQLSDLRVDATNPAWIVAELVIPDTVGGFYIREVGLFDSAGDLIAVGKFPESYKPTLPAGSNKQIYVRMILEVANTSTVTLKVDPSVVLATRAYVDQKVTDEINRLDDKRSVRVATTTEIALSGLQTIDGVVLTSGDRVLVKDQATGAENGVYVAAAGVWPRSADADAAIEVTPGLIVAVEQGTTNADSVWALVTDGPITLGVTTLSFDWIGRRGLASLASPAFTGAPSAPTPNVGDDSTRIATTEFVRQALGGIALSVSETAIWRDRAALLDPACYRLYNSTDDGAGWSATVPAGETWWLVNGWHVLVNGGSGYDFLRVADVNRAVPLSAGTVLGASAGQSGYAYVAKPALVTGDVRYDNPKGLYFERLARLRTLTHYQKSVVVSSGATMGTNIDSAFPTDFTRGLLLSASVQDVSWVGLNAGESIGALNLLNEISDDHQVRQAEAILLPFNRATFPNLRTRPANVAGTYPSPPSLAGYGAVRYVKLPLDW